MRLFALIFALGVADQARADCADTGFDTASGDGVRDEDCDEDGWTKGAGDCADRDPGANPGLDESCGAPADENCDGFFDEGCVRATQGGSLLGGSACGTGSAAALFLTPLLAALLLGRRR